MIILIPSTTIKVNSRVETLDLEEIYSVIDVNNKINIRFYNTHTNQIIFTFEGIDGVALYQRIMRQGLLFNIEHAAYIGYELARADYALINDLQYVQE